jgi:hypothetical protein
MPTLMVDIHRLSSIDRRPVAYQRAATFCLSLCILAENHELAIRRRTSWLRGGAKPVLAPWWIYLLLVLFSAALLMIPWLIRILRQRRKPPE